MEIKKIGSALEAIGSQILYISSSHKKSATDADHQLEGRSVLIITDSNSAVYGINFVETGTKQSFQISKSAIESHHLKVNSSLVSLGIPVN